MSVDESARTYLERIGAWQASGAEEKLPDWWVRLKREAAECFAREGFPDPRAEEWRYTNVRPIAKQAFKPAEESVRSLVAEDLAGIAFSGLDAELVVIENGRLRPELGRHAATGNGSPEAYESLSAVMRAQPERLEGHFGQIAGFRDNSFAALNTAFVDDGIVLDIPADTLLERPIRLLFVSTDEPEAVVSHPRVFIRAGCGSRATVLEHYVGLGKSRNFTNALSEIQIERNASLEHYRIQQESPAGFHVASIHVHQHADSRYVSNNIQLGGRLARTDINIGLLEPGCEAELNGLFMVDGRQHIDNHTRTHHAVARTRSQQDYKGVLNGHGRGVFKGRVLVDRGAQKTEAHQKTANLVLSEHAEIDTKPELEIYADDVICSHGATVGQLDEAALFYLRSRALDEHTARSLLTFAFADRVIAKIGLSEVRAELENIIVGRLPESEMLKGFV